MRNEVRHSGGVPRWEDPTQRDMMLQQIQLLAEQQRNQAAMSPPNFGVAKAKLDGGF